MMYEVFQMLLDKYGVTAYRVSKETGISTATLTDWTKDERDIKKKLDSIMDDIKNQEDGPLYFNGEEIDDMSLSLLENALESAMKQLKIINKEKYNPRKGKK